MIINKQIYCKQCDSYYQLYVKNEKLCSQQLIKVMIRYIGMFLILIAFAQAILFVDSYLKQRYAYEVEHKGSSGFEFAQIDNWILMIPLTLFLLIIMGWCFYYTFIQAVSDRRRLIWVEVMDMEHGEQQISRYQSKKNLNLIY